MSNIYLKVTIEKNWRSQNFDFQSLKKFVSMSVFGNLKIKNQRSESKSIYGFCIILILKGIVTFNIIMLWWLGACERKKSAFFVTIFLPEGNFFNICVLSQCIVYWINSQNIYTLTYQNNITSYTFLHVFKIVKTQT